MVKLANPMSYLSVIIFERTFGVLLLDIFSYSTSPLA